MRKLLLITTRGSVISSECNVNNPEEYPYHAPYPHGNEKITCTYGDEVVESCQGDFDGGQYSGKGRLVRKGKVFEDTFSENFFVSEQITGYDAVKLGNWQIKN